MAADKSGTLPGVSSLDLASELAAFQQHRPWPSGVHSKSLFKADDLRLLLIAMESGAKMQEHHADGTVYIHALQGTLCVHIGEQSHVLHAGQLLTVAPGILHDVEAREDAVCLLTIAWPGRGKMQSLPHRGYGL
ncbi:MAG: cupin domain-containing protein [Terriglobales bacterium]